MKISIARALAEHKLIDKKLERLMSSTKYCSYKRGKKNETSDGVSIEDFSKRAQANYDKIVSLISNKNAIKAAVVCSNANTKLVVGKTEMTVAAAIERKRVIEIERLVLGGMKNDYVRAKQFVEQAQVQVQNKLDTLLESNFGAGKGGSAKTEEVEAISKPYMENNQITLIDPIGIDARIQAMESEIDEFSKNVDFALNESNVRTEIDVEIAE